MNKYFKKAPILLFIVSWIIHFIYTNKEFSIAKIGDPDRYIGAFKFFIDNDYNTVLEKGTSYLYNTAIGFFYFFTNDVNQSFFLTNVFSELTVIGIGVFILYRLKKKLKSKYFIIVALIYIFNTLSINAYHNSNNDMFQSIFILSVFYLLFEVYHSSKKYHHFYIIIGVLCAFCTLIRPTSLILICVAAAAIVILEFFKANTFKSVFKSLLLYSLPLILLTLLFHYPSLKANGALGFYNKNFEPNNNWVQRNYLGTKRMQSGALPIHKNSIFRETTFADVNTYLEKNGEDSLPKNQKEFIIKDPLLTTQIVVYNLGFIGLKASRYYAFLVLIPFLFLVKKPFLQLNKFPVYVFVVVALLIATIILTLMEYRWIIVYDILLCAGLLISLNYYEHSKHKRRIHQLVNVSLVAVTIFNLLLTFYINSNY